jgi:hypothetical protein
MKEDEEELVGDDDIQGKEPWDKTIMDAWKPCERIACKKFK